MDSAKWILLYTFCVSVLTFEQFDKCELTIKSIVSLMNNIKLLQASNNAAQEHYLLDTNWHNENRYRFEKKNQFFPLFLTTIQP